MRIEIHQATSLTAHIFDNQNRLLTIIPQYDILGLPDLIAIPPDALHQYLSNCYTRLSQTSDGSYLLRLHPKLKGGGDFDFFFGLLMVAGGAALTVLSGGLASVPGAALASGGFKGCIHAYNSNENFTEGYWGSVLVGGVTGTITGGMSALGPAVATISSLSTTSANIGVNMAGGIAASVTEAKLEGRSIKPSEVITSALVSGVAAGIQSLQTDKIAEAAKKGKAASDAFNAAASNLKQNAVAKVSSKAAEEMSKEVLEKGITGSFKEVVSASVEVVCANSKTALEISIAPTAAMATGLVVGGVTGGYNGGRAGAVSGAGKGILQGMVAGVAVQTQGTFSQNLSGVIVPGSTAIILGTITQDKDKQEIRQLQSVVRSQQTENSANLANLRQAEQERDARAAELNDALDRLRIEEEKNKNLETKNETKEVKEEKKNELTIETKKEKPAAAIVRVVEEQKEPDSASSPDSSPAQLTRRRRA